MRLGRKELQGPGNLRSQGSTHRPLLTMWTAGQIDTLDAPGAPSQAQWRGPERQGRGRLQKAGDVMVALEVMVVGQVSTWL